jgi:hypothetical protein
MLPHPRRWHSASCSAASSKDVDRKYAFEMDRIYGRRTCVPRYTPLFAAGSDAAYWNLALEFFRLVSNFGYTHTRLGHDDPEICRFMASRSRNRSSQSF